MEDFQFRIPTQVLCGRGRIGEIGREGQRLGGHRGFVVTGTTATRASAGFAVVLDALRSADLSLEIYDRIEPDPTLPEVEAARRAALDFGADMVVAYGGGSPLDAGKTIAMLARNNAPLEDYLYVRKTYDQTALLSSPSRPPPDPDRR
jgi:alcohol dehydrogenase class IV